MGIFYEWRCKEKPAHITKQTKPFSSLDIYSNSKVTEDDKDKDYKAAVQQKDWIVFQVMGNFGRNKHNQVEGINNLFFMI